MLVLTKADLVDAGHDASASSRPPERLADFDDVVVISALEGFNVDGVLAAVERLLPEGPRYFPEGMSTDQPLETMLAEFVREKVLERTRDEVPHAVGVAVDDLEVDEKRAIARITATIYVERDSQKGIIVGKGGEMIRDIGTTARKDIERLLGTKVHLDLRVKVRARWRSDAEQVRRFGYGQGL